MKLKLNTELCSGHGRCYVLSPDVFETDDDGYGQAKFSRVPDELIQQARIAVINCPEDAITLISEEGDE
jgi:ferredoxin